MVPQTVKKYLVAHHWLINCCEQLNLINFFKQPGISLLHTYILTKNFIFIYENQLSDFIYIGLPMRNYDLIIIIIIIIGNIVHNM